MRCYKTAVLIFAIVILFGIQLSAIEIIEADGKYGWKSLLLPPSASVSAMAGTGAANSSDAASFIQHPTAGVVGNINSISLSMQQWMFDTSSNVVAINRSSNLHSLGFALRYLDYGKIDSRDITGDIIGEYHPLDVNLITNFAYRISPSYYAGINLILLYQKIDSSSSLGLATDIGLSYLPPINNLNFHLAVKHLGLTSKVKDESIKLPYAPEITAGYFFNPGNFSLYTEVKALKYPDDSNIKSTIGVNFGIYEIFKIRGGYMLNYDLQDFTTGLGISLLKIDVDYAYLPFKEGITDSHSFSVTYKF